MDDLRGELEQLLVENEETAFTVTSSWVLSAGDSLRKLSRECGESGVAIVDATGFDGHAVASMYYMRQLLWCDDLPMVKKKEPRKYVFGGGVSFSKWCVRIEYQLASGTQYMWVDLVTGSLPLLLGREWGNGQDAWIGCREGVVLARSARGYQTVATNAARGLILISLCGEVDVREVTGSKAVLAAAREQAQTYDAQEASTVADSESEAEDLEPGQHAESRSCAGSDVADGDQQVLAGEQAESKEGTTDEYRRVVLSSVPELDQWQRQGRRKSRRGAGTQSAELVDGGKTPLTGAGLRPQATSRFEVLREEHTAESEDSEERVDESSGSEESQESSEAAAESDQSERRKVPRESAKRRKVKSKGRLGSSGPNSCDVRVDAVDPGVMDRAAGCDSVDGDGGAPSSRQVRPSDGGQRGSARAAKNDSVRSSTSCGVLGKFTQAQMLRAHRGGHRKAEALLKYFVARLSNADQEKLKAGDKLEFKRRLNNVISTCEGCKRRLKIIKRGSIVPQELAYMQRNWGDVMVVSRAEKHYALAVIDDATRDICLEYSPSTGHRDLCDAYFFRWASMRGKSEKLTLFTTDEEASLRAPPALEWFSAQGVTKNCTAAFDSDAHSTVERLLADIRESLDICYAEAKPQNVREFRWLIYSLENDHRNIVTRGGFSSSQRAFGRGSSWLLERWERELPEFGTYECDDVRRLMEIQHESRKALFQVRCKRTGYALDKERLRPQARLYDIGELVYYRRPDVKGRSTWLGPAIVAAVVPEPEPSSAVRYKVDHNGNVISVGGKDHIIGCDEYKIGDSNPLMANEILKEANQYTEDEPVPQELDGALQAHDVQEAADEQVETLRRKRIIAVRKQMRNDKKRPRGRPQGSKNKIKKVKKTATLTRVRKWTGASADRAAAAVVGMSFIGGTRKPIAEVNGDTRREDPGAGVSIFALTPEKSVCSSEGECVFDFVNRNCNKENKMPNRYVNFVDDEMASLCSSSDNESNVSSDDSDSDFSDHDFVENLEVLKLSGADTDHANLNCQEGRPPVSQVTQHAGRQKKVKRREKRTKNRQQRSSGFCTLASGELQFEQELSEGDSVATQTRRAFLAALQASKGVGRPTQAEPETKLKKLDSELEAYGYTWNDVPEDEKEKAYAKGIADYDDADCWDRTNLYSAEEVRAYGNEVGEEQVLFRGHWELKAKVEGGRLIGRARYVPHGFQEADPGPVDSPTVSSTAMRCVELDGLKRRWTKFKFDIGSAFFDGDYCKKQNLWVQVPGTNAFARLKKEVPGTKGAPRSFYQSLVDHLLREGCLRSRQDLCVFYVYEGVEKVGEMCVHVDDGYGWAKSEEQAKAILAMLERRFKKVKFRIVPPGEPCEFTGSTWTELLDGSGTVQEQHHYLDLKLQAPDVEKYRAKQQFDLVTEDERGEMRTCNGAARWASRTNPEILYELSRLSTWTSQPDCQVQQLSRAAKMVRTMKNGYRENGTPAGTEGTKSHIFLPRLNEKALVKITMPFDAGEPSDDGIFRGKWMGAFAVGVQELIEEETEENVLDRTKFGGVHFHAGLTKRVANSSFRGETVTGIQGLDAAIPTALMVEELIYGIRPSLLERLACEMEGVETGFERSVCLVPIDVHSDCEDLCKVCENLTFKNDTIKRTKTDVFDFRELLDFKVIRELRHISGTHNPLNAITKKMSRDALTMHRFREMYMEGRYQPVWGPHQPKKRTEWTQVAYEHYGMIIINV